MAKRIKLYFDGVAEDCLLTEHTDEFMAHTRDGRFVKFPKDFSSEELNANSLEEAIKLHNAANKNVPQPPAEPHEDEAALQEWLGNTSEAEARDETTGGE